MMVDLLLVISFLLLCIAGLLLICLITWTFYDEWKTSQLKRKSYLR